MPKLNDQDVVNARNEINMAVRTLVEAVEKRVEAERDEQAAFNELHRLLNDAKLYQV